MSYYGVVFPDFWTGTTGREIREYGGKDAQILALYLMSNRHMNMLGLYPLNPNDVRHETGLGWKGITRGYQTLETTTFAAFDGETRFVWVRQMARFRLGLKPSDALHSGDLRVKAVNRIYEALDPNPFLADFHETYHRTLKIRQRRDSVGHATPYVIISPLQAPTKPLLSQSTEYRDQTTENREQKEYGKGDIGGVGEKEGRENAEIARRNDSAPHPIHEAFARYQTAFLATYGAKPTFGGAKDGARMKQLLARVGLPTVLQRLDAFFVSTDPWVQRSGHTLDVFFASGTQTKLTVECSGHLKPASSPLSSAGQSTRAAAERVKAALRLREGGQ